MSWLLFFLQKHTKKNYDCFVTEKSWIIYLKEHMVCYRTTLERKWHGWHWIKFNISFLKMHFPAKTETGFRISRSSQIIMSPWREQCAWCNHGNTVTETGGGTERCSRMNPYSQWGKKKIALNQLNEQSECDKFILWETSLEQFRAACVNLQYSTCRDEEDNVSVCSSSLPRLLSASLESTKGSLTRICWF